MALHSGHHLLRSILKYSAVAENAQKSKIAPEYDIIA